MFFQLKLRYLPRTNKANTMTNIHKNQEIPKFLLDKRYLFGSVVFVLTFSVLFMWAYTPFSNTAWFSLTNLMDLGKTVAFYTVAVRRGLKNAWLAWIPVADAWLVGSISDQYR